MNYKKIIHRTGALLLSGLLATSLAACAAGTGESGNILNTHTESISSGAVNSSGSGSGSGSADSSDSGSETSSESSSSENGVSDVAVTQTSYIDTTDLFSNRDLDPSYDSKDASTIKLSDSGSSSDSKSVKTNGSVITITGEGIYVLSGSLSDGQIVVDADDAKVQLVLDGVSVSSSSSAAIYVKNADKVFITLAEGSKNSLATTGEYVAIDENNIDAVIYAKDDIVLNGSGSLTVSNGYGHGIVGKDDIKVTGGTYKITASSSGINAKDSLRICGGSFTINAGTDALHASNDEDDSLGYIYINGGTFELSASSDAIDGSSVVQIDDGDFSINAGDDGIHCDLTTVINGGEINVLKSYEGIEGTKVIVNGGNINVYASDDGLNAAGGNDGSGFGPMGGDMFRTTSSDSYIMIGGGRLYINSDGDGVDANGALYVTGGYTRVDGPVNSGNGALDYDSEGTISGGTFIALGSSGMAMNFNSAEQGSILVNAGSFSAGDKIKLTDANGNVLLETEAVKTGNSILISSGDLNAVETYTLTVGSTVTEIDMAGNAIYGSGPGFGGGQGFGKQWNGNAEGADGEMRTPPEWNEDGNGQGFGGRRNGNAEGIDGEMQTPPEWNESGNGQGFGGRRNGNAEGADGEMQTPPEWSEGNRMNGN